MKSNIFRFFIILTLISIAYGQSISSLNGYKYVFVPPIKYNDGRFDIWGISSRLREYFSKKGFIVLSEQSTQPEELLDDPCLLLRCGIEHSNKNMGTHTVTITLINCNNEIVFSNTGGVLGWTMQDGYNKSTKKAFEKISAFKYKYDPSLTPRFDSPEIEKTYETEDSLKSYLSSNTLDPIEGIYNSIQDKEMSYYKFAIINSGGKFKAIIIESSPKSWKPGEVKAIFEPSSMRGLYAVKWYSANKTSSETFGMMENAGLLSIEFKNPQTGEKRQDKFVKMFPPVSGDVAASKDSVTVSGSGFFVSVNGIIATNAHVVEAAKNIEVTVSNEIGDFTFKARILLADSKNDVALIQIDDEKFKDLSSIPYGFVEKADPGEKVFTIGYPLNDIMGNNYKVTDGIISARSGIADDVRYFQISVPLQPGNSGGPLFNGAGNIIGLTSAKLNSRAVGTEIENVNYAIKTSYLVILYNMLPNSTKLGTSSQVATKQLQDQVKILKNFVCLIRTN
jgi:S1-C subfamily serine protease